MNGKPLTGLVWGLLRTRRKLSPPTFAPFFHVAESPS
jgi:hypothetical protein